MDKERFRPGAVDYGRLIGGPYERGRALSPQATRTWRRVAQRYFRPACTRILDVGCGTGRFSALLANWTGAAVVGVDPSAAMLRTTARDTRPTYVRGRAEAVPLRSSSCDGAWLSQVVHHLPEIGRAAAEIRRVLVPGAPVVIRGNYAGRLEGVATFAYFPGSRRIAESFPTLEDTIEEFAGAGFELVAVRRVWQVICAGLRELAQRTATRADSTLALLETAEFARGQAALERAAAAEVSPAPVRDPIDVVVLRAR